MYGFEVGLQVHEDREATYFLTEFRERDSPVPPELGVVTLVRSDSQAAFVAVVTIQSSGQGSPKRRLTDAAIASFNAVIRPALAKGPSEVPLAKRVRQFFYVRGRHFKATDQFQNRFKYRKPSYEQPLLDIWWERATVTSPFAPGDRDGVDATLFPVMLAEATRARAPASPLPRSEPAVTRATTAAPTVSRQPGPIVPKSGVVTVPVIMPFGIERPPYHWQQLHDGIRRTWEEALAYCDALELGGFTDWKLPDLEAMGNIKTDFYPGIRTRFFPGIVDGNFWTSELRTDLRSAAAYISVGKNYGGPNSGLRSQRNLVLCVRETRG